MSKLLMCVVLGSVFLTPALADRPINETVPADADGEVSIELIAGTILVTGWDKAEVEVSGTVGDDVEEVEISSSRGRVSIEVKLPHDDDDSSDGRSFSDADAELEIRVPVGSLVEAESISADFDLEQLTGEIEVESVSGDVGIKGSPRQAEVSTVSGDVTMTSDAPLEEADFESVSGSIEVRAALAPGGEFSFETVSGDVELRLPGGTSAQFDVETFSGRIENEFGPPAERDNEFTPAKSLEFSTGGGDARVEVESFSGKIELLVD
jgi:hypothetical protein